MPVYDYKCDKCGYTYQILESYVDSKVPKNCINHYANNDMQQLTQCAGKWVKQVSKSSFTLSGKRWSKDGYSDK